MVDDKLAEVAIQQIADQAKRYNGNLDRQWQAITKNNELLQKYIDDNNKNHLAFVENNNEQHANIVATNKIEHDDIVEKTTKGKVNWITAAALGFMVTISTNLGMYVIIKL